MNLRKMKGDDHMNTMIVLLVSLFIPIFITMMFIPYWTRRTESFGVSIPEDEYHSVSLKKMRKHYVWTTLGLSFFMMISLDRKSTRLNSSHVAISYAVFCLKKKKMIEHT